MISQHRLTGAAVAAALVLGLTACGGSADSGTSTAEQVYEEFAAMSDAERQGALVTRATEEGSVIAYLPVDAFPEEVESQFEAAYPGIDLQILNPGSSDALRQKVLEQERAGGVRADVLETQLPIMELIFAEAGVVAPWPDFIQPDAAHLAPGITVGQLRTEHATETFQFPFAAAWNTDQISGSDVPRRLQDFTNPVWNGRLAIEPSDIAWYITMYEYLTEQGRSGEEFTALFRHIGQNAATFDSHNPIAQYLASGQYLGTPTMVLHTLQRLQGDPPVSLTPPVEPVVLEPVGIGLVRRAEHPAAAMLFAQWYLNEGSNIIVNEQYIEQNPRETDLKGAVTRRPNLENFTSEQWEAWRVDFREVLQGNGTGIPDYISQR